LFEEFIKCLSEEEFKLFAGKTLALLKASRPAKASTTMAFFRALFNTNDVARLTFLKETATCELLLLLIRLLKESSSKAMVQEESESFHAHCYLEGLSLARVITQKGKSCLTPQRLLLLLNTVIITFAELEHHKNHVKLFSALFNPALLVLCEAVASSKAIVLHHLQSFTEIVKSGLNLLLSMSRQSAFEAYSFEERNQFESCLISMDRLITFLCAFKADFAKQAPSLIAMYVQEAQKESIHFAVKKPLLSTVYRVLKVITVAEEGERSLAEIHCRLTPPGREVFKLLLSNYDKYYRFKGYV
jgi:hypothetical protein